MWIALVVRDIKLVATERTLPENSTESGAAPMYKMHSVSRVYRYSHATADGCEPVKLQLCLSQIARKRKQFKVPQANRRLLETCYARIKG